jgi:CO/xanthine dehydrogenase FAD-binding subunit
VASRSESVTRFRSRLATNNPGVGPSISTSASLGLDYGAAARPLRLKAVEDAVLGKPRNAATGEMAGRVAVQGAVPLQFNAYKIPLMRNLVKRAIVRQGAGVEEATWAS